MTFFDGFANLLQNTKIDNCLGLLKACFKRIATREGPFVVPVHTYGVSGIIVSCYVTTVQSQIKNSHCRLSRQVHRDQIGVYR